MDKLRKIENIRDQIDEIDSKILNLISKRKDLVTEVVKFKDRNQIIDQKRIDEILKKLDEKAKKSGVSQALVKELWNAMIRSFISYEEEIYDKIHKK